MKTFGPIDKPLFEFEPSVVTAVHIWFGTRVDLEVLFDGKEPNGSIFIGPLGNNIYQGSWHNKNENPVVASINITKGEIYAIEVYNGGQLISGMWSQFAIENKLGSRV